MQPKAAETESLGDHIRKARERKAKANRSFSLRQLAIRCDVSPAYLSRVERNEVSPPGEETLLKLADELGEDKDVMLAMAGKISGDLRAAILARPKLFAELIRTIHSIPDHAVIKIVREVKDGKW